MSSVINAVYHSSHILDLDSAQHLISGSRGFRPPFPAAADCRSLRRRSSSAFSSSSDMGFS
jgi:hypothetical protein